MKKGKERQGLSHLFDGETGAGVGAAVGDLDG